MLAHKDHWLVRETRRAAPHAGAPAVFIAQPVALIKVGSCFTGTLAELARNTRAATLVKTLVQ